ncbi:putative membrane protein [Hamiltosporidium tvaerminnensis]|uniref:Putative membrane protein n=1 Tax=Hamiltosporidium tvaerminnensis TaxID=1176355 RepID=A0A4Q9LS84_9MICR|nr:putative membrane protein [Hamiltosporidium tvaerminnensis]
MEELYSYIYVPRYLETRIFIEMKNETKKFIRKFNNILYTILCLFYKRKCISNVQIIQSFTVLFGFLLFRILNPAEIYHYIRLQGVMKLYVLFNVLEVADKLVGVILNDVTKVLLSISYFNISSTKTCTCMKDSKYRKDCENFFKNNIDIPPMKDNDYNNNTCYKRDCEDFFKNNIDIPPMKDNDYNNNTCYKRDCEDFFKNNIDIPPMKDNDYNKDCCYKESEMCVYDKEIYCEKPLKYQNIKEWNLKYLCICSVYFIANIIQTGILYIQYITLHVSINGSRNNLYSLLISNHFVELKSNIFKKMDTKSLFNILSSDISKRFNIFIYLIIILFSNIDDSEVNESVVSSFNRMIYPMCVVFGSKIFIDCLRHCYICRYNNIFYNVYLNYKKDESVKCEQIALNILFLTVLSQVWCFKYLDFKFLVTFFSLSVGIEWFIR